MTRLMTDERDVYKSIPEAFDETLRRRRHLWLDARFKVDAKRGRATDDEPSVAREASKQGQSSPAGKKESRTHRLQEQVATLRAASGSSRPQPKASQGPKSDASKRRVPEKEWASLKRSKATAGLCLFYNTSVGCTYGDACKLKHVCWSCGGAHRWVDAHSSA